MGGAPAAATAHGALTAPLVGDFRVDYRALCLRWGGPSWNSQEPPTVSAYLLRRDLGGLKLPLEAGFERLLFHSDANWPVDVEERVAPRSGILFGPAAWAEIACSS